MRTRFCFPVLAMLLLVLVPQSTSVWAQQGSDTADRLRRAEQEEQRRLQRIEELRRAQQNPVSVRQPGTAAATAAQSDVSIPVTKVIAEGSKVLPEAEIRAVVARIEGKTVKYKELLETVEALNALYRARQYIGFAFLPPQKMVGGVLRITMLDGKLGKLEVKGAQHTREDFARAFIRIELGGAVFIGGLGDDIEMLRASTDLGATIDLKPGEKTGEVDAILTLAEPVRNYTLSAGVDNFGSFSTGKLRSFAGFSVASLTGRRDALALDVSRSEGARTGALSYETPLGTFGTRLRLEGSASETEVIKGAATSLNVKGPSFFERASLTQVLIAKPGMRVYGTFSVQARQGWTKLSGVQVGRENYRAASPGLETVISFGPAVLFTKVNGTIGVNEVLSGRSYNKLVADTVVSVALPAGFTFIARGSAQYAPLKDPLPASEKFSLGGFGRLRGYPVDYFSGSQGYYGAAELGRLFSLPIAGHSVQIRPFALFEFGRVHDLVINPQRGAAGSSAGGGIDIAFGHYGSLRLAGAAPLMRISREQNRPGPTFYGSFTVTPF